ncbi:MAG TPA: molybdenum cofactor biosynthesis protein [Acidimicrobiaceae bacterium]|jgi:molybdopterin adenylyltransferase|nr:molybdenum cofactor biosynthesis protein [Acidimicrobiaceae bacterium]
MAHHSEVSIPLHAKVLTVSDGVASGEREDTSGPALVAALGRAGFTVVEHRVVADGAETVANALSHMAYFFRGVVVTTGGTGFGPRDKTPEGTRRVLDRRAPGLAEAMRAVSPLGKLSRGVAGTRGRALILNTAGSPAGAVEMLEAVIEVVPHALSLMAGENEPHPTAG